MSHMTLRGLKIFFKNKGGVFFSLFGVIMIFCLFIFFIGDSIIEELGFLKNAKQLMTSWIVAGMLASSAITTSMGAYALMISDKENKCVKDFYSSPISLSSIAAAYMVTGFIISIMMSIVTFIFGEIYIVANGGEIISFVTTLKIFGVIMLSSFSSSALVCFIMSFVKTSHTYTMISIILGTLIGFLVGAYICIGYLPTGVQWVIKCFPCAHAAVLFRQLLMAEGMIEGFATLPAASLLEFKEMVGLTFNYGAWHPTPIFHMLVLVATGVVFYLLAIINMSHKSKKINS